MIARLLCLSGMHQWEENSTIVKEPIASDDGLLMTKISEKTERFCLTCGKTGGVKSLERYEIFEDYYSQEDEWD